MDASECLNSSVKDKNDQTDGQSSSPMAPTDVQFGQGATRAWALSPGRVIASKLPLVSPISDRKSRHPLVLRTKRPEVRVLSGGPSNHPRQSEVIRICNSAGLASSACYTVRTPPGVAEPGETSLGQRPFWRFTRLFSPRPVPAAVAAFPPLSG